MIRYYALFCLLAMFSICSTAKEKDEKEDTLDKVEFRWNNKIPMRDGILLNATFYKSLVSNKQLPTIFMLTPYISDHAHDIALYFAQNGYHFVSVDTRGRGNSEGKFVPMLSDAQDGYDIVEWIAQQSWSDGQVGMWGGSYLGYTQWATLKEFPPHLKTIVPTAAVFAGNDFPMENNIPYPYSMQWLSYTSGKTANKNFFGNSKFWQKVKKSYFNEGLAFTELPRLSGNDDTVFSTWAKHPELDEYWDSFSPSAKDYRDMNIPILTITGHYDGDQEGAMLYYNNHQKYAKRKAANKHYLIMGPWDHSGTRRPKTKIGGIEIGEPSKIDIKALHLSWYDWVLKGKTKPEFLKKRVAYYVIGPNEWRYADSLSELSSTKQKYYLGAQSPINGVFNSGTITNDQKSGLESSTYVYNPININYEPSPEKNDNYYLDQSDLVKMKNDGLIFHSNIFEEDAVIIGQPKLALWLSLNVKDTDFHVNLYEIKDSGESIFLADTMIRARYRQSLRKSTLIVPGEINEYVFDRFKFIGRKISEGSRLRIAISSHDSGFQTNYNGGGDVYTENIDNAKTANIKLYHSKLYPSYLEIPLANSLN